MIRVRLAKNEDSNEIFEWRNDPVTREMFINSDIVKINEHREWFESTQVNKNRCLFMCIDKNENKIGIVRFDLEDYEATISINLNPNKRKLGLAKFCLKYSIIELRNLFSEIRVLKAEIKDNNFASRKTFVGIGFKYEFQKDNMCYYQMNIK